MVFNIGSVFDKYLIIVLIRVIRIICLMLKLNNVVCRFSFIIIDWFNKLVINIVLIIFKIEFIIEIISVFFEKIFKIFLLFVLIVCNILIFCLL